jgi:hypothetical protein
MTYLTDKTWYMGLVDIQVQQFMLSVQKIEIFMGKFIAKFGARKSTKKSHSCLSMSMTSAKVVRK